MKKVRNLSTDEHFGNEVNHLIIKNLGYYLKYPRNKTDYYRNAFEILAELEAKIKYENEPEDCVLIPYKPDGDMIFRLVNVVIGKEDDRRYVVYEFDTTIS